MWNSLPHAYELYTRWHYSFPITLAWLGATMYNMLVHVDHLSETTTVHVHVHVCRDCFLVFLQVQPSLSQSSSTSSMNELMVVDPPGSSPKLSRKVEVSWWCLFLVINKFSLLALCRRYEYLIVRLHSCLWLKYLISSPCIIIASPKIFYWKKSHVGIILELRAGGGLPFLQDALHQEKCWDHLGHAA